MRAILLILILAVVAIAVAVATDLINVTQTEPARVPDVAATDSGIKAQGGQAPAFDVETGSISVGAREQNLTVPVPRVNISPADEQAPANEGANAAANAGQPAAAGEQAPAANAQPR